MPLPVHSSPTAPTADQFFKAAGKNINVMDHEKYMSFAELYADFVVEFEKRGGDIKLCERWPTSRAGKMVDL